MALVSGHTVNIGDQVQQCCKDLETVLLKIEHVLGQNSAEQIDWTTASPIPAYFDLDEHGNLRTDFGPDYDRAEISDKIAVLDDVMAIFKDGHADVVCGAWRRGNLRKSLPR